MLLGIIFPAFAKFLAFKIPSGISPNGILSMPIFDR